MLDEFLSLRAGISFIRGLVRPMQTWKCLPVIINYSLTGMVEGTDFKKPADEVLAYLQAGRKNIKHEMPFIYKTFDNIYYYLGSIRDFIVGKTTRRLLNIDFSYMNAFLASSVIRPEVALFTMLTSASIGCYLNAEMDRRLDRIKSKYDICKEINEIKPDVISAIEKAYLREDKTLFNELKSTKIQGNKSLFDVVAYHEPGTSNTQAVYKFDKKTLKPVDSSKLKTNWARVYANICLVFLQEDFTFVALCFLVGKATNIAGYGMYVMAYIWRAIELKPRYDVEEKLQFEMELMGLDSKKLYERNNDLDVIKHKLSVYRDVFSKTDVSKTTLEEFKTILSTTEAGNEMKIKPEKSLLEYLYNVVFIKGFGFTGKVTSKKEEKETAKVTSMNERGMRSRSLSLNDYSAVALGA